MLRKINLHDLRELEGRNNGYPMPNILNPTYEVQWALVEDDSRRLVGAMFGKKTCEITLIMKDEISWASRMRLWLEAFEALEQVGLIFGYDDTHVFIPNELESYIKLLRKIGFVDATGVPLYYALGSSEWLKVNSTKLRKWPRTSQKVPQAKLKQDSSGVQEEPLVVLG